MKNTPNQNCLLCTKNEIGNLTHTLLTCEFNMEVSTWLLDTIRVYVPHVQPKQVVHLNLGNMDDSLQLPIVWLITNTLHWIWKDRVIRKKPNLQRTRSSLEAQVNILRKSRFKNASLIIQNFGNLSNL